MKKLSTYLMTGLVPVLIAALFTLGACSQDPIQDEASPALQTMMTDEQVLEYMGYDLTGLVEYEEYYMIGDETVSKQRIEEVRNEPETRVPYHRNQVLDVEHQKIVLILSGQFQPQIREAAEEWNKLYNEKASNIQFVFTNPGKSAVEFNTNAPTAMPSGVSIVADPPYKGANATRITLNMDFDAWNSLVNTSQIKYLYMHALGHLVGMQHALDYDDQSPPLEYDHAGDYRDPTSIMMPESGLLKNKSLYNGFSTSDKNAIRTMYPYKKIDPTFTMSSAPVGTGSEQQYMSLNTEYEFTAKYDYLYCPDPTYQFTISKAGINIPYTDLGGGKIKVKFAETGSYTVTAKVTNSTEQPNSLTKTYYVITSKVTVEGPSEIELGGTYDFKVNYSNPTSYPNIDFDLVARSESSDLTPEVSIQKMDPTTFRVCFIEPGELKLSLNIKNGPIAQQDVYDIAVYYRPYYKVERIKIDPVTPAVEPPTRIIDGGGGGPTIPPSSHEVYYFYNVIKFYADVNCFRPAALAHDFVFKLQVSKVLRGTMPLSKESGNPKPEYAETSNNSRPVYYPWVVSKGVSSQGLVNTKTDILRITIDGSQPCYGIFDPVVLIECPANKATPIDS